MYGVPATEPARSAEPDLVGEVQEAVATGRPLLLVLRAQVHLRRRGALTKRSATEKDYPIAPPTSGNVGGKTQQSSSAPNSQSRQWDCNALERCSAVTARQRELTYDSRGS